MIALARIWMPKRRHAGFAVVALLGGIVGGTTLRVQPSLASSATVLIAPADAAALIDATSGEHLAQARAVGEEARLINASMPFSALPITAARPFDLSNSDPLDHRRALLCLTQAVYYEAGFEPMEGRRAVAQVVLNRMRHPAFPKSVCGVVYQGARAPVCQFSFVCDGALYRRPALGAWKQAEQVAAAALDGFVDRAVGAATHYHADYVVPVWAPTLVKTSVIGRHIFYRLAGGLGQANSFSARYAGLEPDAPAIAAALGQAVSPDLSPTSEPVSPAARPVLLPSGSPVDGGAQATPSAPSPSGRWVVPSQGIDVNNAAPAR